MKANSSDKPDLKIARKVLGVLQDVEDLSFDRPNLEFNLSKNQFNGCGVFKFDLNNNAPVSLPETLSHALDTVDSYLRSTDSTDPWGMLFDGIFLLKLSNQPHSSTGNLFLFSMDYIADVLNNLFPNTQITPAERKVLLQSLSGINMRTAADLDSVSYETKKSQLKSVFQKTRLHGQQTLSSFLITHLTLEAAAINSRKPLNAESDEMFFHYVDNFMGQYVRASVIQESPSKRFRVIEIGDPAGTPLVCIHHLGIINFSEEEIAEIYQKRIRLICPLRHGALGPLDKKIDTPEYIEHAITGIDLAVSLTGQKKTVVVSMLSGSLYALQYFEKFGEKIDKIIMLAASYKPPTEIKSTSTFKNNLHDLASNHEITLEATISTLLSCVDKPEKLKRVVKESHNNNDADNQTIDELFTDSHQVSAMQHRLRNSPLSIIQDLKNQAVSDWTPLQEIETRKRIHFIHGTADRLIPIENIRSLLKPHTDKTLHEIEGAGNWIFGKYTKQTMSIIREIIDNVQ